MKTNILGFEIDLPLEQGEEFIEKYGLFIMIGLIIGVIIVFLAIFKIIK